MADVGSMRSDEIRHQIMIQIERTDRLAERQRRMREQYLRECRDIRQCEHITVATVEQPITMETRPYHVGSSIISASVQSSYSRSGEILSDTADSLADANLIDFVDKNELLISNGSARDPEKAARVDCLECDVSNEQKKSLLIETGSHNRDCTHHHTARINKLPITMSSSEHTSTIASEQNGSVGKVSRKTGSLLGQEWTCERKIFSDTEAISELIGTPESLTKQRVRELGSDVCNKSIPSASIESTTAFHIPTYAEYRQQGGVSMSGEESVVAEGHSTAPVCGSIVVTEASSEVDLSCTLSLDEPSQNNSSSVAEDITTGHAVCSSVEVFTPSPRAQGHGSQGHGQQETSTEKHLLADNPTIPKIMRTPSQEKKTKSPRDYKLKVMLKEGQCRSMDEANTLLDVPHQLVQRSSSDRGRRSTRLCVPEAQSNSSLNEMLKSSPSQKRTKSRSSSRRRLLEQNGDKQLALNESKSASDLLTCQSSTAGKSESRSREGRRPRSSSTRRHVKSDLNSIDLPLENLESSQEGDASNRRPFLSAREVREEIEKAAAATGSQSARSEKPKSRKHSGGKKPSKSLRSQKTQSQCLDLTSSQSVTPKSDKPNQPVMPKSVDQASSKAVQAQVKHPENDMEDDYFAMCSEDSIQIDLVASDLESSLDAYSMKLQRMKEDILGPNAKLLEAMDTSSREMKTKSRLRKTNSLEEYTRALREGEPPVSSDLYDKYNIVNVSIEPRDRSTGQQLSLVERSTSDVTDMTRVEQRKRRNSQERKNKYPHKSDPFAGNSKKAASNKGINIPLEMEHSATETKEEILGFLNEIRQGTVSPRCPDSQEADVFVSEPPIVPRRRRKGYRKDRNRLSNVSVASSDSGVVGMTSELYVDTLNVRQDTETDVERVDSGVGPETIRPTRKLSEGVCEDCDIAFGLEPDFDESVLCVKCRDRKTERMETIQEIVDTEISYGRDLRIMKEEFYKPLKSSQLLNSEQLRLVFINLDELIEINDKFSDRMQDLIEISADQGDEDFNLVNLGQLFLHSSNMFLAFESYCVNHSAAPILIEQLEKEKELLKVFLQVSQTENSVLRRMDLKAFLMIPVQRIVKYPLLLRRLYKSTPTHHSDREAVKKSLVKVEDILDHINSKTKGYIGQKLTRKTSSKKHISENIELHKVALDALGWITSDASFVSVGRLQFAQDSDNLWTKFTALKFVKVYALLLTNGTTLHPEINDSHLAFPSEHPAVKQAALVLVREKSGKYVTVRDPIFLDNCVVSMNAEMPEILEVFDINREMFLLKGEGHKITVSWYNQLRNQAKDLGKWRARRNALANIMIQDKART